MSYFEGMVINIVFLLFPLLIYLLYVAYQSSIDSEENSLFFSIALITSLYLIMRYGTIKINEICLTVLFNIPLLLSYIKGKRNTAIAISLILVFYNIIELGVSVYLIGFEYVLYYFIYAFVGRKNLTIHFTLHAFVLIKTFFLTIKTFFYQSIDLSFFANFGIIFLNMLLFYAVACIVFLLLKKAEEIISLNQSLKELEKEKFLRTSLFKITHEIKNPIAVCKGYLDMLDFNNTKQVNQYLPIVRKEIERTLTLMEDYSDYTKVKVETEIMDLYLLLEDTKGQLETLLSAQGIESKFKIPEEELYIEGDYNRLKQVLINLFKNAVEAKSEERPMCISLTTKKYKKSIDIVIKDNGIGMDEETLARIPELFYTTKNHGTGLGVALSNEIIERHGGKMKYTSKEKEGTTVTIVLPFSPELNV